MNIEDLGYQILRSPITQVKCSFHEGKWHVEYRKPGKGLFGFITRKHWFHDSKYSNYLEAHTRAEVLAATGYYETLEKKFHIYDVNQNNS